MQKLSDFIIGILLIGVIATSFFIFTSNMGNELNVEVNSEDAEFYQNTINKTQNEANKIQDKLQNINVDSSISDRLGAYFGAGYDSLLLVGGSLQIFFDIFNKASASIGLPGYVVAGIIGIIVIIIFVGIIGKALTKVDI